MVVSKILRTFAPSKIRKENTMSQKFKKIQNKNDESTAYGKWFATAVYDQHFIETEELANFIQTQASVKKREDCGAQTITTRRVLFQPETERVVVGQKVNKQGKISQKYVVAKSLVKDVTFEETYDTSLQPESDSGDTSGGGNG